MWTISVSKKGLLRFLSIRPTVRTIVHQSVTSSIHPSVSQLIGQSSNEAEKASKTAILIGHSVIVPVYEQAMSQLVSKSDRQLVSKAVGCFVSGQSVKRSVGQLVSQAAAGR